MLSSIKAKVMRLTAIDTTGAAAAGDCSSLVTGGFIGITPTPEYERGDALWRRNIWRQRCGSTITSDELQRITLSIRLCGVDPAATAFLAEGVDAVLDPQFGVVNGIALVEGRSEAPAYALEVWSKVAGSDCGDEWIYWLFPRVRSGALGGWSLDYSAATFTVEASTQPALPGWGGGPYLPAPVPDGVVIPDRAHAVMYRTPVPPPVASDGCVALTA